MLLFLFNNFKGSPLYDFAEFNRAYPEIIAKGQFKSAVDDFKVDEIMGVELSGEGEHLWLQVEKTDCNTDWAARILAQQAGIKLHGVSYAGLKDRFGITCQWFSLHLPGKDNPEFCELEKEGIRILQQGRHRQKLKRGGLQGNRFALKIRHLQAQPDKLENRLQDIAQSGVPNYFGRQRFGFDMGNLHKAEKMFAGHYRRLKKHQRSLYLSAARSWIFNSILSARIQQQNWNQYLPGDVLMLAGKSACFADDGSADIARRIEQGELHPTGAMWGDGESQAAADCAVLEAEQADKTPALKQGLIDARLKHERRALRLMVNNMSWQIGEDNLALSFDLPPGAYATMVLREIGDFIEPVRGEKL